MLKVEHKFFLISETHKLHPYYCCVQKITRIKTLKDVTVFSFALEELPCIENTNDSAWHYILAAKGDVLTALELNSKA